MTSFGVTAPLVSQLHWSSCNLGVDTKDLKVTGVTGVTPTTRCLVPPAPPVLELPHPPTTRAAGALAVEDRPVRLVPRVRPARDALDPQRAMGPGGVTRDLREGQVRVSPLLEGEGARLRGEGEGEVEAADRRGVEAEDDADDSAE